MAGNRGQQVGNGRHCNRAWGDPASAGWYLAHRTPRPEGAAHCMFLEVVNLRGFARQWWQHTAVPESTCDKSVKGACTRMGRSGCGQVEVSRQRTWAREAPVEVSLQNVWQPSLQGQRHGLRWGARGRAGHREETTRMGPRDSMTYGLSESR